MDLGELLSLRGFDRGARTKIVRHQDARFDCTALHREGLLDVYQSFQSKPVFDECDFVVTLIGAGGTYGKFVGVYSVGQRKRGTDHGLPSEFPRPELIYPQGHYYPLTKCSGYEDLEGRVVVDWGKAAITWHQWFGPAKDKPVVEVLPTGFVRQFPGYDSVVLRYDELRDIMLAPESNRQWHLMLSAVAAIYLIVDSATGAQYVGSASGRDGLLGRWRSYASAGHGGNERLRELCDSAQGRANDLRFSILRTLPRSMSPSEVVRLEGLYKEKLGTRASGLNCN